MQDIILGKEDKYEVDKIADLINTLDDSEKNKMIIFMQGVQFAKKIKQVPETSITA